MADDQSQRPYRASEPPLRGSAKAPGNDPLAELARLIGQTDPFAEFARRTAAQQPAPNTEWDSQPHESSYAPRAAADPRAAQTPQDWDGHDYFARSGEQPAQNYSEQGYARQPYEDPSARDPYHDQHEAHGYLPGDAEYQQGYQQDGTAHEEEYYDEAPPKGRRLGVLAIAGVLALAVVGTAGAFGYRALFGSSGSTQPPPVIKADTSPTKIVPATTGKDTQSGKLITERVNDKGQGEKLVSREEQPIDRSGAPVLTQSAAQGPVGGGVIANEPKKIRTIAIHPDQPVVADAQPPAPPLAAAPATRQAAPAPVAAAPAPPPAARPAAPPPRVAETSADAEQDAPPPPARQAAPARQQAAPASGNAPLSLSPDAAPARASRAAAPPPARTAAIAPAPAPVAAASASAGGSGSYVQLSSQRSEAEAQAAFRGLQAKFPTQLGGRQLQIHKADLGAKGTYYRAMVGPFAASDAAELCSSLKSAGGQCLIQKN